jgi:uncharacterized membrane protein YoaK (UPF0700 family)
MKKKTGEKMIRFTASALWLIGGVCAGAIGGNATVAETLMLATILIVAALLEMYDFCEVRP